MAALIASLGFAKPDNCLFSIFFGGGVADVFMVKYKSIGLLKTLVVHNGLMLPGSFSMPLTFWQNFFFVQVATFVVSPNFSCWQHLLFNTSVE